MDESTMRAFGFKESDMEETNTVYVFEDNWDTFEVFDFLSTQWRTASNGIIGLDYNVFPLALEYVGVDESCKKEVVYNIRVMESRSINIINQSNKRK